MTSSTASRSTRLRKVDSADIPVSSLTAAYPFAKRFVAWCINNGITGPIDWPTLYERSEAFAFESTMRPVTKRALARAFTKLGIPKKRRVLKKEDQRSLRLRWRSDAKIPRVTVYVIPEGHLLGIDDDRQLNFFR